MRVSNVFKAKAYAAMATLALWSLVPAMLPSSALAAGTLSGSSSFSSIYGSAIAITDLQVSDTVGATENVRLTVSSGTLSMTTTTGLTFTGGTTGAQLKFSGVLANVNAALATLHYTRTAASLGTDTLEVSLVGANQVYDPTNGHLYEYVTSDGLQTWTNARTLAHGRTVGGATGYLATITSSDENAFVSARLTGAGWMGASDAAVEGDWKWVEGPETGTSFWSGKAANATPAGFAVGGQYGNWNTGEPNDSGGNEDCGQFLSGGSGRWNDLPCTVTTLAGYVVEYGAPGNLPSVASKTIALTTTAGAPHTVSTCAQLQTLGADTNTRFDTINIAADLDCTGVTFVSLYQADGFHGTLNGQGHKITHLTINQPSTDAVGLFSTADNATIEDLTLDSGSVTGQSHVGALVGYASDGLIVTNVTARLDVTGTFDVGGLFGDIIAGNTAATITNCAATGNITATGIGGGLAGFIQTTNVSTTFSQVFATGNVTTSGAYAGGLVALAQATANNQVTNLTFQDVYAHGNVTATTGAGDYVGGLIGYAAASATVTTTVSINNAYASGDVSGHQYVGGLIGMLDWQSNAFDLVNLTHSFAAGHVSATVASFGASLVGLYNQGPQPATFTANYYDATRTAQTDCGGGHPVPNCTAVNVADAQPDYFKSNHANAPMSSWDFTSIWVTNDGGYPTFLATDDGDNISAAEETAGPNLGDADADGLPDAMEANVASFSDPVSGHYVALKTSCGNLFNVQVGGESTQSGQTDVAYSYPAGLVGFVALDCTTAATATFTQYYYALPTPAVLTLRKWNSATHSYSTVPGAVLSAVTIGGQTAVKVVYQVTDGGPLDQDGTANGNIVDPVGPGVSVLGVPNTGLGALSRQ